jgi:hypothetical protein
MNIKPVPVLLSLTIFITACSSMKVTSERDKKFDFGQIQSYQWIDGPQEILDKADTYINEDIRQALNTELLNRGLRQLSDGADADVRVAYYVKLREELEYTDSANPAEHEFSGGFVYNREARGWSYAEREPDLNIYTVETGTLTVLIYDTETGSRVWRGNLQTKIDRSRPKDKRQAQINEAAKKIMNALPATKDRH